LFATFPEEGGKGAGGQFFSCPCQRMISTKHSFCFLVFIMLYWTGFRVQASQSADHCFSRFADRFGDLVRGQNII